MSLRQPPQISDQLAAKRDRLHNWLAGFGRVAVAFSAGVDSTVLAKAARLACGDGAVAVTAVSASLASGEREAAERLAAEIGIRHVIVQTGEFDNPDYLQNAPNRCYFCKNELYTRLDGLAAQFDVAVVVNGANLDDRGDHRPGMQAAAEHSVRSPLMELGFSKQDVRELARDWNLPVWDKPATPCLSSRIAYGLEVTEERVQRVDRAEQLLRAELEHPELRVRHEFNELARIEVPVELMPRLLQPEVRARVAARLRELGFRYVTIDLEGFRSGSMNAVIPVESLQKLF